MHPYYIFLHKIMLLYLEVSKIWVLSYVTYIATDRNFLTTDFSDQIFSLIVIVVFVNFSHFYLLQNHWANWHNALGKEDSSVFK